MRTVLVSGGVISGIGKGRFLALLNFLFLSLFYRYSSSGRTQVPSESGIIQSNQTYLDSSEDKY